MNFLKKIGFSNMVVIDHFVKIYFNGAWRNAMGWIKNRKGKNEHYKYI